MSNDKICDGCNNNEIKLHNCEMCKKDFCINCMYLFCSECKEYYSCFWCGSELKLDNGIENINNEKFRCKKHQIELPKFKIQYRRYTEFEEEKQQYKFGTPKVIITKSGDFKWVNVYPFDYKLSDVKITTIEENDVNTMESNL